MSDYPSSGLPSEEQIAALAETALVELVERLAEQAFQGLPDGVTADPARGPVLNDRTHLRRAVLGHLRRALERQSGEALRQADETVAHTVLVVEDDLGDALLIQDALDGGPTPRTVRLAPDGAAALEQLLDPTRARPDLVILDLNLPRVSGQEVLHAIKDDTSLRRIPVVVLSTSSAPADIADAYRAHANAYVTKPHDPDALALAVRAIDSFFLSTVTPG